MWVIFVPTHKRVYDERRQGLVTPHHEHQTGHASEGDADEASPPEAAEPMELKPPQQTLCLREGRLAQGLQ